MPKTGRGGRRTRGRRPLRDHFDLLMNINFPDELPSLPPLAPAADPAAPAVLRLPLNPRVPLVKLDTVIAARGENPEAIYRYVERGTLRWLWNLASQPGGGIRDLRFWNREVHAFANGDEALHARLRRLPPQVVIEEVLGERQQFHAGEVCLLLGIRRPTLMGVRDQLLTAGQPLYQRRNLEQFLQRRLQ